MALSPEFRDYVLELLDPVQPFTLRPMFGLISRSDALYLKTDEQNRAEFEALDSEPHYGLRAYWLAPADLLEDPDRLCELALGAIAVSRRSPDKPKKKSKKKAQAS